jgi:uncharacterized protein (TIGR00369 family)
MIVQKGGSLDFEARNAGETALTLTMFTQPEHSNSLGNVHGGVILKLCDECGGIIAARHARRPAVTVTIDSVNFLQPVLLGRLLHVHGHITWIGRTSIEVALRVEAEYLLTGERLLTNDAYFVFVALDENRRPAPVPPLLLDSEQALIDYEAGAARHQHRLADAGRK